MSSNQVGSSGAALRAVATGNDKGENPVAKFSKFMDGFKSQLALALPKHMTADRMSRLALTQFSQTPALQACEPRTIAASVMVAAQLGLEIGVNGAGYLIPYGTTCTFVPGWKGLVDLVSRSGRGTVWTGAVFEGDTYDYALGDRPFVNHKPGIEDDPAKLLYVYAVGRVNGSDYPVIEVWPIEKVRRHRDKYNRQGKRHYSFRDWEMYARKIPLLQVIKYMPTSIEVANAVEVASATDRGAAVTIDGNFVSVQEPTDNGREAIESGGDSNPQAASSEPQGGTVTQAGGGDEQPAADAVPSLTYAQVMDRIVKASNLDILEVAGDSIGEIADEEQRGELTKAFKDRMAALKKKAG